MGERSGQTPRGMGLQHRTTRPSDSVQTSTPLLLCGTGMRRRDDHVRPSSDESERPIHPLVVRQSMWICPAPDSHRAGWIAPGSGNWDGFRSIHLVDVHDLPWSVDRSTKTSHFASDASSDAVSRLAPASHTPERVTRIGFLTGPRPPMSPTTSSVGRLQERPSFSDACTMVRQTGTFAPTLNHKCSRPELSRWRTGFQ